MDGTSSDASYSRRSYGVALIGCRSLLDTLHTATATAGEEQAIQRTEEELRVRCADLLDELGVAPPFNAWQLCELLGERRQRRIKIQAADLGGVTVIGHLLAAPGYDRILHDSRAPRSQQELVIYHEVTHLILGHLDTEDSTALTCGALLRDDEDEDGGTADVDLQYSIDHEWEAETGATELARLAALRPRPDEYIRQTRWHGERGVAATFGLVTSRWRSR